MFFALGIWKPRESCLSANLLKSISTTDLETNTFKSLFFFSQSLWTGVVLILLKGIFNFSLLFKTSGHYFKAECLIIEIKILTLLFNKICICWGYSFFELKFLHQFLRFPFIFVQTYVLMIHMFPFLFEHSHKSTLDYFLNVERKAVTTVPVPSLAFLSVDLCWSKIGLVQHLSKRFRYIL